MSGQWPASSRIALDSSPSTPSTRGSAASTSTTSSSGSEVDALTIEAVLQKRRVSRRGSDCGSTRVGGHLSRLFDHGAAEAVGCAAETLENIYSHCVTWQRKLQLEACLHQEGGSGGFLRNPGGEPHRLACYLATNVYQTTNGLVKHLISLECPQAAGHYQLHGCLRELEYALAESRRVLWRIQRRGGVMRWILTRKDLPAVTQALAAARDVCERIAGMVECNCLAAYADALKQQEGNRGVLDEKYILPGTTAVLKKLMNRHYIPRCAWREFAADVADMNRELNEERRYQDENDARAFSFMLADGLADIY